MTSGNAETEPTFKPAGRVLCPASVAIVGASERARWPAQIIANLKTFGYPGGVTFVNPGRKELYGQACYPRLVDVPKAPEHAMIIVPATAVPAALEDAEAAGVKSATVYASRLGDGDDPDSHERGAWLKRFLATSKIRVSGPNCMGAMSFRERLFAYPSPDLGLIGAGPTALAFQSGGILMFFMQTGSIRGLRFSYAISTGNEVDLDLADYLNFLVDDPGTRVITLFIEGIRRPRAFMAAAVRALEAGKPVLAIKTGLSAGSAAAAQSHTGAIAGDYAAYLAMCDRCGIVVCRSLDDLVQQTLAFQYTLCGRDGAPRRPKGRRQAYVTTSGGAVDLLYDHCEIERATLSRLSPETDARLRPLLQEGIAPTNPLDAGIPVGNPMAAKWCAAVLDDPGVDMLAFPAQPRTAEEFGDIAPFVPVFAATDKPVIGVSRFAYQPAADVATVVQDGLGIPILHGLDASVRAMKALAYHAGRQGRRPACALLAPAATATASSAGERLDPAGLDAALARYGIVTPVSRVAPTPQAAAEAAEAIGFPVALKIQSASIRHKTEAGGVMLGLADRKAVEDAARALTARAEAAYPQAHIDGFLVQQMVDGVEVIAGARCDAMYGPVLLVGAGGILVELARDVALELLPVKPADITRMIDGLATARLLAGYRGRPPADRSALEAAIANLAQFYLDHRDRIRDIEINPLMVRADGKGAVAVDVRVIWNETDAAATGGPQR